MKTLKEYLLNTRFVEYNIIRKFIGGKWVKLKLKTKNENGAEFWIQHQTYSTSSTFYKFIVVEFKNYG